MFKTKAITKVIILILLTFQSFSISAQGVLFDWVKTFSQDTIGSGSIRSNKIHIDMDGNLIHTGVFRGTVDFDPGPTDFLLTTSSSHNTGYIQKLDSNGNFLWAISFVRSSNDNDVRSITTDQNGYVYVTGYYEGFTDFDPTASSYYVFPYGDHDIFIEKFDPNGNLIWIKTMGGSGDDKGESIKVDSDKNVYIYGEYESSCDFDTDTTINLSITALGYSDVFVSKLDSNGNYLWAKSMGGPHPEYARGMEIDSSNNIYITGTYVLTGDFDPGVDTLTLNSNGGYDAFIEKLDSAGNLIWAKSIGGSGLDIGYSVTTDNKRNVYVMGIFESTADFDPDTTNVVNKTSNGMSDVFLLRLDTLGNFNWAETFGGPLNDYGNQMILDDEANLYTIGVYEGTIDVNPDTTQLLFSSYGHQDIFIQKVDSTGSMIWARTIGGSIHDYGSSIEIMDNNSLYILGKFMSTVDFDINNDTSYVTDIHFGGSSFIEKLNQSLCNSILVNDTVSACNNYTWINNQNYTTSNNTDIHRIVGGRSAGCDSLIALQLTINPTYIFNNNLDICSGDSLLIYGEYQNTSGTYYDSLQTINGCDSVLSTTLTINPLPNVTLASFNPDTLCSTVSVVALPTGAPSGGNYIGNGVGGGNFDPSIAGLGTHDIIYTYTDGNSCINSDTTIITVDLCIGIDNINTDFGIIIYPNPSTGQFTIEKPNNLNKEVHVKLLDASSKLILEKVIPIGKQKVDMDIRNYSKGIYYLQLIVEDEIFVKQILKN